MKSINSTYHTSCDNTVIIIRSTQRTRCWRIHDEVETKTHEKNLSIYKNHPGKVFCICFLGFFRINWCSIMQILKRFAFIGLQFCFETLCGIPHTISHILIVSRFLHHIYPPVIFSRFFSCISLQLWTRLHRCRSWIANRRLCTS